MGLSIKIFVFSSVIFTNCFRKTQVPLRTCSFTCQVFRFDILLFLNTLKNELIVYKKSMKLVIYLDFAIFAFRWHFEAFKITKWVFFINDLLVLYCFMNNVSFHTYQFIQTMYKMC